MEKINLFHIPPTNINTNEFKNLLQDQIVTDFENKFAEYVGAKYAVSVNSATSAIFLILDSQESTSITAKIPTMIPPVVCNAILLGGNKIEFVDNVDWVGHSYELYSDTNWKLIDSAQRVDRNQFKEASPNDLMIFSFYPTKPVGSCDGGMIVSDNKSFIDILRTLSNNGMSREVNNWERVVSYPGWKMYMNAIQAKIAMENLERLDDKKESLKKVRDIYNNELGYSNTSNHLYRILIKNRKSFLERVKEENIICGIHYHCCHLMSAYRQIKDLPKSEFIAEHTVSIPFHEKLTIKEINRVIQCVKKNGLMAPLD